MVVELTNENFEKEIKKSKTPVIIDFFASWCGPCQMMAPVFEEVSKEYKGKLAFAKVSTEKYPEFARHFQISGIPALVVVDKNKEIGRIVGYRESDELKVEINNIIG